jgi:hypothetical protein
MKAIPTGYALMNIFKRDISEEYNRYLRSDSNTGFSLTPFVYVDFMEMYIIVSRPGKKVKIIPFKV